MVQIAHDFIEVVQRAEARVDGAKISYIVTKVLIGTRVNRRKPHGANAKPIEMIDSLHEAGQIALAIPIAILERYHGDLIHYRVAPPGSLASQRTFFRHFLRTHAPLAPLTAGGLPGSPP